MEVEERIVPMRLQRFLARAGVASRRGSENLMTAGRVSVNGEVVRELGSKVDPLVDTVCVDGREVRLSDRHTYLVLNKPAGYLTTMSDPYDRPCVAKLVPTDNLPGLFPVGRLDMDTTGVLLFTTDGNAGNALLHPSQHVYKRYVAHLSRKPSEEELDVLRQGVVLDDGPCQPAEVELADESPSKGVATCTICIHEGRKHQVKRMFEAIGCEVVALTRVAFGPISIDGLAEGRWRNLTEDEVSALLTQIEKG